MGPVRIDDYADLRRPGGVVIDLLVYALGVEELARGRMSVSKVLKLT